MRKIVSILAVALFALVVWACGTANTPSAVAEKSIECLKTGDYEGYADLVYYKDAAKAQEQKEALTAMLKEKMSKVVEKQGGIKSYSVVEEKIADDGKTAVVRLNMEYENGKTDTAEVHLLTDENGKWKINAEK